MESLFYLAVRVREEEWDQDMNQVRFKTGSPKTNSSSVLSMFNFMQMSNDANAITNKATVLGGGSPSTLLLVVSALRCFSFA